MYFPYLRGRQFELIALRELLEKGLLGEKIIPIVEPIKLTSTLAKTLETYTKGGHSIGLVINPEVGEFVEKIRTAKKTDSVAESVFHAVESPYLIRSFIMKPEVVDRLKKDNHSDEYMIINRNRDSLADYMSSFPGKEPRYTLIPDERAFARKVTGAKVIFGDKFFKAKKNADYILEPDQFFSEEHLYFEQDGLCGFSDYSIVGEEYMESGFAPTAVAIHIVYFDDNMELRVRHFVSDSNIDISDPAGKFGEAVEKLVMWLDEKMVPMTAGLSEFVECYETGKYPGLGTVKKLSIMHHLELMNRYLEGEWS